MIFKDLKEKVNLELKRKIKFQICRDHQRLHVCSAKYYIIHFAIDLWGEKTLQELQMLCGTGETKQANQNDIFWQIIIGEYLDYQWPCFWHFDHPLHKSFSSSSYQRYYHWLGSFLRNDSMSKLCQRQLTYLHKTSIVAVVITDHFQNNWHVAYFKKSTIIFWRFQWWNQCDVRYHILLTGLNDVYFDDCEVGLLTVFQYFLCLPPIFSQ